MNLKLFNEYISTVFNSYIEKPRSNKGFIDRNEILLMNSYSIHTNQTVIDESTLHGVDIIT